VVEVGFELGHSHLRILAFHCDTKKNLDGVDVTHLLEYHFFTSMFLLKVLHHVDHGQQFVLSAVMQLYTCNHFK
jgi:hypothetical protein